MLRTNYEQPADRRIDYQVHDADPASLVAARLRRSGYPFMRSIKCEFRGGVIVLSGTVPTYHLKQLAQELACHTPSVQQVENRLRVTSASSRTGRSTAAG